MLAAALLLAIVLETLRISPRVGANQDGAPAARLHLAPPRPEPLLLRPLDAETAIAINAAIRPASTPGPAAKPLAIAPSSASFRNALDCLTAAIYYEAATQGEEGQRAVAQVVLNRVRHPAYPPSVCAVVFQGSERATGCQFTFTCDGSMVRAPLPAVWGRARAIAKAALSGSVFVPVGHATHYHANYVVPYWASSLEKSAVIGVHIFYRWSGQWGRPAAFRQRYAAAEPAYQDLAARSRREPLEATSVVTVSPELEISGEGPIAEAVPETPISVVADAVRVGPLADQAAGRLLVDDTRSEAKDHREDIAKRTEAPPAQTCSQSATVKARPIGRAVEAVSATASRVGTC
jgi:hypothetical protein